MKNMIRAAIDGLCAKLDRLTKWAADQNAREKATKALAKATNRKYAREIRFLAEELAMYGADAAALIRDARARCILGHSPDDVMGDMLVLLDEHVKCSWPYDEGWQDDE